MAWVLCWPFHLKLPDLEILFWATQDSSLSMAGLPGEKDAPQEKWCQESIRQCYCTICFIFIGNFYYYYSSFLLFSFSMRNTGKVALEYTWMEAGDSEAVTKPYSTTLMRKDISLGG